jgi:hypothetical protein
MDHPIFGTLRLVQHDGWIGSLQIGFFSEFDDVATALYVEKFGGFNYNEAANQDFRQGLFELQVVDREGDGPSVSQERALLQFVHNQQLLCPVIIDAIFDYYRSHRENWRTGDESLDDITVPPVQSPDDLRRLIRLDSLFVLDMSRDDLPLIGLCFACSWDIEHGLGVLIHGTRLVEVGENDITWTGPSKEW